MQVTHAVLMQVQSKSEQLRQRESVLFTRVCAQESLIAYKITYFELLAENPKRHALFIRRFAQFYNVLTLESSQGFMGALIPSKAQIDIRKFMYKIYATILQQNLEISQLYTGENILEKTSDKSFQNQPLTHLGL